MDLKSELEKVERKLRNRQEELETDVVKAFVSYVMADGYNAAYEKFEGRIEEIRSEYIRTVATLHAVCLILDWKGEE